MPIQTPQGTKLTLDDYLAIPNDGRRHEIIDGVHYVNAAPAPYHQIVLGRLLHRLMDQIDDQRLGLTLAAPTDVLLSITDIVEPDILVILEEHRTRIGKARIEGPPDLAIEVLSPSTRTYDRKTKRACYARFGIPEFWLVDPEVHEIEQLVRPEQGACLATTTHRDRITLHVVPAIRIDLSKVW